jgi:hypothetical protein
MQSAPSGLTSQEARRRLAEYGPNDVEKAPRQPCCSRLPASASISSRSFYGSQPVSRPWPSGARAWHCLGSRSAALSSSMASFPFGRRIVPSALAPRGTHSQLPRWECAANHAVRGSGDRAFVFWKFCFRDWDHRGEPAGRPVADRNASPLQWDRNGWHAATH